ncbi:MAG: hypothetical protein IJ968_08360, partial [Clostridia bacterium]|nr:hypothetical protein [Clostridia bacterium]
VQESNLRPLPIGTAPLRCASLATLKSQSFLQPFRLLFSSRHFLEKNFNEKNISLNPQIEVAVHDLLIRFASIHLGISCVIVILRMWLPVVS